MSFLVVPNAQLVGTLQDIIDGVWGVGAGPLNIQIDLFQTNITPAHTDTAGVYTPNVATFPGYGPVVFPSTSWAAPVLSIAQAYTLGPPCSYVRSALPGAPQTIYGYYVTEVSTGRLLWAQAFDTPVPIVVAGDNVLFIPQFSYLSQH